ncbi:MAG TPA: hypothetical protein VLA89_06435 [Gemmatimonadales bacterium]|nr:hypothetical protein [Gemmatimonadales bacterium]
MPDKKKNHHNRGDNNLATLKQLLQSSGIPVHAFHDMLEKAVRLNWNESELLLNIYGSKQFKRMFPGIFRPDGSLKMSPYEYRQMSDEYRSQARLYGVSGISKEHIGQLIKGDVSMQEFTDRMTAIQRVTEFQPAFDQFKKVAKDMGFKTKGLDSDKDAVNFLLGKADKKFYDLWDRVSVGTAASVAGFDLGLQGIKDISKRLPGVANEVELQSKFANLAQEMRSLMPLSQIGKYGLTKQDLIDLEFGGPNQAAVAEKVDTILKNRQAFNQGSVVRTAGNVERAQF